jgi:hypothetical protein
MGIELMPWQVRAITDQLALDVNGDFLFREALVSTARQNGKSFALKSLAAWWLVVWQWVSTVSAPHTVSLPVHSLLKRDIDVDLCVHNAQ